MPRPIRNNLTDMDIDEISTVDKAANQYSRFVIAKRAPEEDEMPKLYNQEGQPLDEESLEFGDIVYDDQGAAYEFVEDDGEDQELDDQYVDEDEMSPVGKGAGSELVHVAGQGKKYPISNTARQTTERVHRAGQRFMAGKNKNLRHGIYAGAGGAAAVGGGAAGYNHMKKSFSDEVMEELSKAFSDDDRDAIISKALGRVEELETAQHEAFEIAKSERDLRLTREYISKAADYNLPIAPDELGPVLYRMAETMSYDDCSVIAKCLETAGAILFEEAGYSGGGDNADVYSQVEAHAYDSFGKSENFNPANAIATVFDQNPDAYDEYLSAQRNR